MVALEIGVKGHAVKGQMYLCEQFCVKQSYTAVPIFFKLEKMLTKDKGQRSKVRIN